MNIIFNKVNYKLKLKLLIRTHVDITLKLKKYLFNFFHLFRYFHFF